MIKVKALNNFTTKDGKDFCTGHTYDVADDTALGWIARGIVEKVMPEFKPPPPRVKQDRPPKRNRLEAVETPKKEDD